ncbi:MAG: formate dehydrogenase accessory protein FdhE [Acidimicrobiia bacterium]|nr:formate dehydrogenase accessory protein FdhE [Acidimicrobiia bacterium]
MPHPDLSSRLARRLDELGIERADLRPALALQRNLIGQQLVLLGACEQGGVPHLSLPPRYLAAKLARGLPALHSEPVPLPNRVLVLAVHDFCARLSTGSTAEAAAAALAAFNRRLDPAAILSACFGRDQGGVRMLGAHAQVSPDLLWLVAELALAPFAYLLARQLFPGGANGVAAPVAGALAAWDRGFCPVCGSWAAWQEGSEEGHRLRCSFCSYGWTMRAYRCAFCGEDGEPFVTAAPNPEEPGRRLQLCGACGGYSKVLPLAAEFPLVAVEDLASLDLDMAAMERKYIRPALPGIRKG